MKRQLELDTLEARRQSPPDPAV